ncbi:MAG: uridine kinase [Christensenellales bacterium]
MNKYTDIKHINKKIENNLEKFVFDTDSRYRGQLFDLVNKIIARNNVKIVLLAGPSCAGKTTTANLIKQVLELKGRSVDVISMDDFFIDLDKRKLLPNGKQDFDSPDVVNCSLMKECFSKFFSGEDTYFPEYDFKNSKSIPNSKLYKYKYNSIIIFEGIHVLNPILLKNLGTKNYFKIYVSPLKSFKKDNEVLTTKNLRLLRRSIRDIQRRNTPIQKTIEMWPEVVGVEEQYIEPFRTKVDYYVDTTHDYELGIYKGEVERLSKEGKLKPEEVPFIDLLEGVDALSKSIIPETSLMWEFVDRP